MKRIFWGLLGLAFLLAACTAFPTPILPTAPAVPPTGMPSSRILQAAPSIYGPDQAFSRILVPKALGLQKNNIGWHKFMKHYCLMQCSPAVHQRGET